MDLPVKKNVSSTNDLLERKQSIINLTSLIDSLDEPFVISINGSWGSGKTRFIELWKTFLEDSGYKSLYFNAWENDFSKEPFLSIASEIKSQIIELNKQTDGQLVSSAKVFYDKSMALAVKSLPAIVKLLSNGMLNIDALKDIVGDSKKDLSDVFSKVSENLIQEKDLQKELRESLEQLADKAGNGKKIIFFIDELDRCRPNYAVELLENIKHFFSVKGFVFILAVDKEQLGYSLQTLYGAQMDTEGYLRRFIDLNFNLPIKNTENFINSLPQIKIIDRFISTKDEIKGESYNRFKTNFKKYSKIFKLTLRDIEQLYTHASIAIQFYNPADEIQETLIPFLLVLKIKRFKLYEDFVSNKIIPDDLIKNLETIKEYNDFMVDLNEKGKLEVALIVAGATSANTNSKAAAIFNSSSSKYSNDIVTKYRDRFITNFKYNGQLKKIEEIIEFSGNF